MLSHQSAAVLWGLCRRAPAETEVSIPRARRCRRSGIRVLRPRRLGIEETTIQAGIPVTTPARTLLDVAARFEGEPLEAAVNEAVRLGLTSERELWTALDAPDVRQPGVRVLRGLLEGFMLTDSRLERLFVPIARRAGLSRPRSQERVNGFRVDFYWPDLGLVVETDGGAFHRTPAQQARDRRRDQAHTAAGLTPLRFTHLQVANHPGYVQRILERVAARLDG